MDKKVLENKSLDFALSVVAVARTLQLDKEFVLSRQFMRSGTAIGAMIREARFAQSKADFVNKMSIALKEANEAYYWILLLERSNLMCIPRLKADCDELIAMLVSTVNTAKKSLQPMSLSTKAKQTQ